MAKSLIALMAYMQSLITKGKVVGTSSQTGWLRFCSGWWGDVGVARMRGMMKRRKNGRWREVVGDESIAG